MTGREVLARHMSEDTCTIPGCVRPHYAKGWCNTHYIRWRRSGATGPAEIAPPRRHGADHHAWTGQDASYTAVHIRLRRHRGRAADYQCSGCGQPASDWAYDHADPAQRTDKQGSPYSTNLDHYSPLCRGCHWKLDGVLPPAPRRLTHCRLGHEFTPENTIIDRRRNGRRRCRTCENAAQRARYARRRSQA